MARLADFIQPAAVETPIVIADPCAGEGMALRQLGDRFASSRADLFAMELDIERGERAAANLDGATVVAPCDFLKAQVSSGWASLVWCNPPYDSEIGGGRREEEAFLEKASRLLVDGGILMFALPESKLKTQFTLQRELLSTYTDLFAVWYPPGTRKFNEVCVFGVRRSRRLWGDDVDAIPFFRACRTGIWNGNNLILRDEQPPPSYALPAGTRAKRWAKGGLTPVEIAYAMATSPTKQLFAPPPPRPMPRPGLQLGANQRALILAGGFLNRTLAKPDQRIHIKATATKEDFVKETIEEEAKTTTVYSQRILLSVRVLDQTGKITTLK